MISKELKENCQKLKKKGFSLNKIIETVKLPKATVYDQIKNISLLPETKKKFKKEGLKRLYKQINKRKKKIVQPADWNGDLIFIVAHFMFDGGLQKYSSVYYTLNYEIEHLSPLSSRTCFGIPFKLEILK